MSREDLIKIGATVIEVLPNTVCRVELANRHRILAHISGSLRMSFAQIVPGDKVTVEMSPYDMSQGCITLIEKK